jgi:hypothetical protein
MTTMALMTERMLNEWWSECGFDEMAIVTGYACYEFSPEDGYQDYIDHCDKIWENFTYGEKLFAYHKVED